MTASAALLGRDLSSSMTVELSLGSMPNLSLSPSCPRSFSRYGPLPRGFCRPQVPLASPSPAEPERPLRQAAQGAWAPFLWGYSEYYSIITALSSVTTVVKRSVRKSVKQKFIVGLIDQYK